MVDSKTEWLSSRVGLVAKERKIGYRKRLIRKFTRGYTVSFVASRVARTLVVSTEKKNTEKANLDDRCYGKLIAQSRGQGKVCVWTRLFSLSLWLRVPASVQCSFSSCGYVGGEERNFRVVAGTGIQSVWLSQLLKRLLPPMPRGGVSAKTS